MKAAILIIFVGIFSLSFGQQSAKEELVDEFGEITCDDFLARIDNLFIHLNARPLSKGYLVISGASPTIRRRLDIEWLFESAVNGRSFDRSRVAIVEGPESGKVDTKIWVVPAGNSKPDFSETKWNLTFRRGDEPFLLDSEMSQICGSAPFDSVAKKLLNANTEGLIYVVVHGKTAAKRSRQLRASAKRVSTINRKVVRYLLRHSETEYSDFYFAVGIRRRVEFKSWF